MKQPIRYTERPFLAHEHPKLIDYLKYTKNNLLLLKKKKSMFADLENNIHTLEHYPESDLKFYIDELNHYFLQSFLHYADDDFARAYFNGYPSEQGKISDAIEGASRNYPLIASYLYDIYHNNKPHTALYMKMKEVLSQGFLAATAPTHSGYWGELRDYNQTICEAADFALALWLTKDIIWCDYNSSQQKQIINWLKQINHVSTVDNNWHLFIVLTQLVVKSLSGEDCICHDRYQRIKEFYVGEGWFRDGVKGNYDYYNSWGFHYALFWIDQIDPEFDSEFIKNTSAKFSEKFKYLFTPNGFAFFGRSIIYRFAAPCGLISNMLHQQQADGQVKRIISTLFSFLIKNKSIQHGQFTQGLFQNDRRLVDSYSGSASAFWSLRTLILLNYGAEKINFWQVDEQPLEIEKSDFDISIPSIHLRILGCKDTLEVCAILQRNDYPEKTFTDAALTHMTLRSFILEKITGRAFRCKNNLLRKGVTCYSSRLNLYLNPK